MDATHAGSTEQAMRDDPAYQTWLDEQAVREARESHEEVRRMWEDFQAEPHVEEDDRFAREPVRDPGAFDDAFRHGRPV